jgi:hypothetical protein
MVEQARRHEEQAAEISRKFSEYEQSLTQPTPENRWAIHCYSLISDCITANGGPDWSMVGDVLERWHDIELVPGLHRKLRVLTMERALIQNEETEAHRKRGGR